MIVFAGQDGGAAETAAAERLKRLLDGALGGKPAARGILGLVKAHVASLYPGSRHWSPDKVTEGRSDEGEGVVDVGIAGASRAYGDVEIRPRFRKFLAIPFKEAYGKKPSDFPLAFAVRRGSKAFLAQAAGGRLKFLFALASRALQRRDEKLMPADEDMALAAFREMTNKLTGGR